MKLRFEKVSDVASKYCHLEIFLGNCGSPFMDVSVEDDQSVRFNIYSSGDVVVLTKEEWEKILQRADEFTTLEILNEESFKKFE